MDLRDELDGYTVTFTALVDAGRDLDLGYAEEGRSALWSRLPDKTDVPKVLRVLADREYLHALYFGEDGVQDFHLG